jgi:hypothetical protein
LVSVLINKKRLSFCSFVIVMNVKANYCILAV